MTFCCCRCYYEPWRSRQVTPFGPRTTIESFPCSSDPRGSIRDAVAEVKLLEQCGVPRIGFEAEEQGIVGDAAQAAVVLPVGAVQPLESLVRFAAKRVGVGDLISRV